MQVIPPRPALIGTDLTARYAHLRTAVLDGRPAVSRVVPSAALGVPVAAFAVPFASRRPRPPRTAAEPRGQVGSRTRKLVPVGVGIRAISPWWRRAMSWAMGRPRPAPGMACSVAM